MEPSPAAHPGGGGGEEGEVVAASAEVELKEATAEPGGSGGTGGSGRGGGPRAGESPPSVRRHHRSPRYTCRCPTRLNNLPLSIFRRLAHRQWRVAKPQGVVALNGRVLPNWVYTLYEPLQPGGGAPHGPP